MAEYRIQNGIWNSVFAFPSEIIDKHLKLCGALSLKVLLIILRHGGDIEIAQLAKMLGQSAGDIHDALGYWVHLGVISQGDTVTAAEPPRLVYEEIPEPTAMSQPAAPPVTPAEKEPAPKPVQARRRLSTQDINEIASNDKNIGVLLQETQSILGKELTPVITDTVVALYSYYGMKPDIILMLIHYCVSIGKGSMSYIEKVAASWLEQGIDTHELAEAEILRATTRNETAGKIKSMFGIYDRALIAKEEKFIDTWVNTYKIDYPLIQIAFERTVETKGKLSFDYINGILVNWYNKGIKTPAAAMQEIAAGLTGGSQQGKKSKDSSYKISELESMIDTI